jgi:hypothetical protein
MIYDLKYISLNYLVESCVRLYYIPVQENQQMLKDVFIILIKLSRHVSAANCHLQGITRSLQVTPVLSAPQVDVSYGSVGVASRPGMHLSVLLPAETCRGNLMSIIKTPLNICWFS